MAESDIHVYPINDQQEHVTVGVDCPCQPKVELVGAGLVIVHNAFDHREIIEQAIAIMNGEE